jgi:hypothetical protein
VARDTKQKFVRAASAEELILANQPDGFRYLLQAMNEMPSFKTDGVQFMRDHFPDLQKVPEDAVMVSLKSRAAR